ncbi:ig-like domain-containing protein [Trichonephila inaurata madagascariensis]|uniref:Ig-like domain-containing protein n=1 Tax=Trichonephila inaurata madagascariensis TaxID=2747483 RepID=A0A8X6Y3Y4_9ARAC|nr:ig-like domain-containing protein [Trichonephila inaurata madagascariensis]
MDIHASSNSITEGSNVTIICNIRSNPVASRTFWLFQDEKILNSPNVLSEGANLFIQGIKRTDAGNYSCQASNIKGTSRAAIQVNVEYAPVCQDIEISAKHRIEHNKDVANVTCNLSSNPGNVTFYWMTRNSSSNHSWSTGRDSYTLLELDENLFEMFCWGENAIGLQKVFPKSKYDGIKEDTSIYDDNEATSRMNEIVPWSWSSTLARSSIMLTWRFMTLLKGTKICNEAKMAGQLKIWDLASSIL